MITWAAASEEAQYLPGSDLVAKLDGLTDEQMEIFLSMFEDPEQFLLSLEQAAVQLQNPVSGPPLLLAPKATANAASPSFPPDYPPGSGPYNDAILGAISSFNISGASSTNRCSATDWRSTTQISRPYWRTSKRASMRTAPGSTSCWHGSSKSSACCIRRKAGA